MSAWLPSEYDWWLLLVASLLASLAGLSAIRLFNRAKQTGGYARTFAVVVAAITVGCGVWSVHLVGLLAYQPNLVVAYDVSLIFLSLFMAMVIAGAGFASALYFPSWVMVAGAVVGIGFAGTHHIAIRALQVPGHVTSGSLFTAPSIMLAVFFSIAALYFAVRRDSWRQMASAVGLFTLAIMAQHITAAGAIEMIQIPLGFLRICRCRRPAWRW